MITRKIIGLGLAVAGLILVFVTGTYLDLFGKKINFQTTPGMYAFFGSIFLGFFGMNLTVMPARLAFISMVGLSALFLLIFVAGRVARGGF